MAPSSIIYVVRHAEGFHQLPLEHPDISIRDPDLTAHGVDEALRLRATFPHHQRIDRLAVSPMRRTIRTALIAFQPEIAAGLRPVALPDAQETTDAPADTGSTVAELQRQYGDLVDFGEMRGDWFAKTGANATDAAALRARAARLRLWLYACPARHIVLVTHGAFTHFLTGDVDECGAPSGREWENVQWRAFRLQSSNDLDAVLVETNEPKTHTHPVM